MEKNFLCTIVLPSIFLVVTIVYLSAQDINVQRDINLYRMISSENKQPRPKQGSLDTFGKEPDTGLGSFPSKNHRNNSEVKEPIENVFIEKKSSSVTNTVLVLSDINKTSRPQKLKKPEKIISNETTKKPTDAKLDESSPVNDTALVFSDKNQTKTARPEKIISNKTTKKPTDTTVFKSIDKHESKIPKILILTQARSGSSFLGSEMKMGLSNSHPPI